LRMLGFVPSIAKSRYMGPRWSPVEVRVELAGRLTPGRFTHSVRVAHTAVALARVHGADPLRAYVAGLLHDCARDMPGDKLVRTATASGLELTEADHLAPVLLHGRVGAQLAQQDFGVEDPEILAAIAHHPTGPPPGATLADVLFVADYVEPGRCFPGVQTARTLATRQLQAAVRYKLTRTYSYLRLRGASLHPDFEAVFRTRARAGE